MFTEIVEFQGGISKPLSKWASRRPCSWPRVSYQFQGQVRPIPAVIPARLVYGPVFLLLHDQPDLPGAISPVSGQRPGPNIVDITCTASGSHDPSTSRAPILHPPFQSQACAWRTPAAKGLIWPGWPPRGTRAGRLRDYHSRLPAPSSMRTSWMQHPAGVSASQAAGATDYEEYLGGNPAAF